MQLPYTTYLKLTKLITTHISTSSSYVPSKRLVRLGLEHFPGTEKAAIVEAIKRMVDERILKPVKVSSPRQVVFGLMRGFERGKAGWLEKRGEVEVRDDQNEGESAEPGDGPIDYIGNGWPMNPVQGTPGTIVVHNANMQHAEKGKDAVDSRDVEEPESQDTPDMGAHEESDEEYVENEDPEDDPRAPIRRHARAYAEMTRDAAPMPPSPRRRSIDIGTPSRKRPREIAASDACSSNEPISPHKSRNSTPQRLAKRLCTPLSGDRRRSAPGNLQRSPLKPMDPNKMLALDNQLHVPLKNEKKNTAPTWVLACLEVLRSKFPSDLFDPDHDHINCLDCDRPFKIIPNGNLNNFETHLRSKSHRAIVDARIDKQRQSGTFVPTTTKAIDFEMPSAPLMVFNQKPSLSFSQALAHLSAAWQADESMNIMSNDSIKQRLSHLESNHSSHAKQLGELLEISKNAEEKYQSMSKANASIEERQRQQFTTLEQQLSESSQARENAAHKAEARFETFEEKQANRVHRLDSKLKEVEENSQDQLKELRIRNARGEKRHKEDFEDIRDILGKSNEENKKLKEMIEQTKEQLSQMSERVQKTEALVQTQETTITDLESQSQVHNEELQRFRENEETTRRNLTAQMTIHFEQTDARIKAIEQASEERFAQFERDLMVRMGNANRVNKERIKSLAKENAEMKTGLQRIEAVMPELFKNVFELQEKVFSEEEGEEEVEVEEPTEGCDDICAEEALPKVEVV